MKERLPYILFAGFVSMILFYFLGSDTSAVEHVAELSKLSNRSGLWMLLPIVVLLLICFKTSDLFMGVSGGILTGIVIGLVTGIFQMSDIFFIDTTTQQLHGVFFDGITSVTDIILSTICYMV